MMRRALTMLTPAATTACVLLAAVAVPVSAEASGGVPGSARAAGGAKLVADYRFDGDLKSSVSGAPRLRNIGKGNVFRRNTVPGEGRTKVLRFPSGNGLKAKTAGLIPSKHYSVVLQFKLASAGKEAYARILNPTLPADDDDNGLYLYNDFLVWYDETDVPGTFGAVTPGEYVEVAFTRSATGKIRVYVNGQPDISYVDADKQAIIRNHVLRFFKDNSNDESSAGKVSRIRLYDDTLTAKRVARIYDQGH